MYIVEFSKGLSLWSCTVQVMKIVAICTTGLTSAYLCVNTVSMTYNCIIIELEGKKKPMKTKRSLKQPNSVGYKLSTNWTVINTLSTLPTKLMSTQESCISWFC